MVYGKFLNIIIFNIPGEKHPTTTILRKLNSKYDIIPFNSNVSLKFRKMAGLGYYKTIKTLNMHRRRKTPTNKHCQNNPKRKRIPKIFNFRIRKSIVIPKKQI